MSLQQASFYCPRCCTNRLFTRQGPNHILHLLLTLFLCGIWLFVWLIVASSSGSDPYFCSACGFADNPRYLANPGLREREAIAAATRREAFNQTAESGGSWFTNLGTGGQMAIVSAAVVIIGALGYVANLSNRQASQPNNFVQTQSQMTTLATATPLKVATATPKIKIVAKPAALKTATVIIDQSALHALPSYTSDITLNLSEGDSLTVQRQQGAWFFVSWHSMTGWIHGNSIRLDE